MKDIRIRQAQLGKKLEPLRLVYYILLKIGSTNHLKLQKLLFYVQAYHLAYFDEPIIDEDFRAWVHGPVLLSVWHYLKNKVRLYDGMILKEAVRPKVRENIRENLMPEQIQFINDVLKEFGKRSDYELECLTHSELPWQKARMGIPPDKPGNAIITKESMRSYYKKKLNE